MLFHFFFFLLLIAFIKKFKDVNWEKKISFFLRRYERALIKNMEQNERKNIGHTEKMEFFRKT